jgi:hypothetical protein
MDNIKYLIKAIENKGFQLDVNLDRPNYVQPEDRIQYRAHRIIIILGMLNSDFGLSKDVIACVDFLLRNEPYQAKFILEYFAGQKNVISKLSKIETSDQVEMDFNIVQYKSVPWDLRFNDMFLYLYTRDLINYKSDKDNRNIRIYLTIDGKKYLEDLVDIFPSEVNFLELFGKKMSEEKTIKIITEVIPNSYWKQNAEFDNK